MKFKTCYIAIISVLVLSACEEQKYDITYPEYVLSSGYENLELAWAEEFDYDGLPADAVWGYEEGYVRNDELQDYKKADPDYSSAGSGALSIKVRRDTHVGTGESPVEFEFSSASLTTEGKRTFGPGRVDIMAKIPTGRGLFPSIALLPADSDDESSRIDLMTYVYGNADARNRVYSTVSAEYLYSGFNMNGGYANCSTLESSAHLYSVVFNDEKLVFLFDNRTLYTLSKEEYGHETWPFAQEFYLLMNVAVGGTYGGTWGVDTTIFPKQMDVDYIRYYREAEEED